MSRFSFNARAAFALAAAVTLVGVAAQADIIILKDGYTLHAVKTIKEKEVILDPNIGPIMGQKANGIVAADDGPRWVVFPSSALQVADVSPANRFKDFASYTREFYRGDAVLPHTAVSPIDTKPWDFKKWTKEVRYEDKEDRRLIHTVELHISVITPYYLRIGSKTHRMGRYILTKEKDWGPERIRKFLVTHPDLAEEPGKPDAGKREKLVRFWIQGDFLDAADAELALLLKDVPTEKERYARLKSEVNSLRAERRMAEIEQAHDAGRHHAAMQALDELAKAFPKEDVPREVAKKALILQAEYATRTDQFNRAQTYLTDLMKKAAVGGNKRPIDAAGAVRDEIHLDTLGRLEMFLTLADRAEKDAKAGRPPAQTSEELLASAITGWYLGKVAAEAKVETAYRVWTARQMALEYLRTPAANTRAKTLSNYLAQPTALKYDELEKLVSLLPPPDAPTTPPTGTVPVQLPPAVQTPNGVEMLVRLPEEYQPGRSYAVLILLPDPAADQNPPASQMQTLLDRFGDVPSKLGYITAAVRWWRFDQSDYGYTKEEHAIVMAALSHLRRTYQVDSDRVFLWGNGEGGSMALDMGGAHPDVFAGVIPENPTSVLSTLYITCEYWVNFYQLPVYMIMGDKFGPSVGAIKMISERWMPKGFPSLIVSYKGRGAEWFSAELPYAFDWMSRKHRVEPGKRLGPPEIFPAKAGFSSVRFCDNRFYWMSTDEVKPDRVLTPGAVAEKRAPAPVKFSATIKDGNTITGSVFGIRQLTVWFGKGMVDYTRPVSVQIATDKGTLKEKKLITPEIPVLMEDLYERGDRQRPYFAKIEFNKVP